jgi:methylated-DNA-[protein]-cysteine S-methyltransferase
MIESIQRKNAPSTSVRVELRTPVGTLGLEGDEEALTGIELPQGRRRGRSSGTSVSAKGTVPEGLARALEQLDEYFEGRRTEFDLKVELLGTPFQRDVWMTLSEIPYGKTVSYGELAAMVGRPTAFRAVGQANGSNPIPIVLPCHRVLAAGGRIGGYGGGLELKRHLLSLEGAAIFD